MADSKIQDIQDSQRHSAHTLRDPEKDLATLGLDTHPGSPGDALTDAEWDNPKDWPLQKKWLITSILSITGFNRIMVSTIMAPALPAITGDLILSDVKGVMALSVFLIAAAFGPLVIGPLSEVYGRKRVLHATSIWFLAFNIVCGFAQTGGTLIAARLLAGFGASAIYALAAGVLSDVWRPEQRGISLTLYILFPLLGAAVGPILGGAITDNVSWRWMFWSTSIVQAFLIAIALPIFQETYGPLLRRRALRSRQLGGQHHGDVVSAAHVRLTLARSLALPLQLLATHPIIQLMSLLSGVNYGLGYILLSTVASTYTTQYHASTTVSGLHYLTLCIGEVIGSLLGGPLMDVAYRRLKARAGSPEGKPEYRIPLMFPGPFLAPIGLLLYGWSAQYKLPWPVVDLGLLITALGLQIGGQATQAYVIDSYTDFAGSASGASQLLRGLAAAGFPLFAPALFKNVGYGWGSGLLALVFFIVALPVPIVLWYRGPGYRAKAVTRVSLAE